MDLPRNLSSLDAHTTESRNPNWRCVDSQTIAVQRSYDFHPKTALLWTFMVGFTTVFWVGVGMLAFG